MYERLKKRKNRLEKKKAEKLIETYTENRKKFLYNSDFLKNIEK